MKKVQIFAPRWLLCWFVIGIVAKNILVIAVTYNQVVDGAALQSAWNIFTQYWQFYAAFALCFAGCAFLFRSWRRPLYLIFVYTVISAAFLGDAVYFRGFKTLPTIHSLGEAAGGSSMLDVVLSMLRPVDVWFVIDLIPMIVIAAWPRRYVYRARFQWKTFLLLQLVALVLVGVQLLGCQLGWYGKYHFIVFPWDNNVTARNISPGGYHIYSVYTYWRDSKQLVLNELEKNDIYNWLKQNTEDLPLNSRWALYKGNNLIVIQVESLENFVVNQEFDGQEITPNLNRMAAHGFYFSNFYEQVNEGNTSDAEFMANCSVYPIRQGSTFFRFPNNSYNTLPRILKRQGYSVAAFQSDDGSMWNVRPAFAAMGFDRFITVSEFNVTESFGMGFADGPYLTQTAAKLAQFKQPFYAFVVTLSSHGPFQLPKKYRELKLPESLDKSVMGDYLQSVNYTDRMIGNFLNELQKHNLLDNTVVAVYGDHEGIHKYYEDGLAETTPQRDWWMKNNHRDPFIIYQEANFGERITTTGGEIDIMPTLLYVMGVPHKEYAYTALGRNLLNTDEDFAVLNNRTVVGNITDQVKQRVLHGLEVADTVIKSNFFTNIFK